MWQSNAKRFIPTFLPTSAHCAVKSRPRRTASNPRGALQTFRQCDGGHAPPRGTQRQILESPFLRSLTHGSGRGTESCLSEIYVRIHLAGACARTHALRWRLAEAYIVLYVLVYGSRRSSISNRPRTRPGYIPVADAARAHALRVGVGAGGSSASWTSTAKMPGLVPEHTAESWCIYRCGDCACAADAPHQVRQTELDLGGGRFGTWRYGRHNAPGLTGMIAKPHGCSSHRLSYCSLALEPPGWRTSM